ncbi:MAG: hypothetical protein QXP53_02100 [Candidatus Pacearchaeota archaeon]
MSKKKEETKQGKKSRFFKAYFILLIISTILGIIDIFFVSGRMSLLRPTSGLTLWIFFLSLFELAFFVLSIIVIFKFIKLKVYLALTAPIFYFASLLLFIFLFSFNLYFTPEGFFHPITLISSAFVNIFLLAFSIFILIRYK